MGWRGLRFSATLVVGVLTAQAQHYLQEHHDARDALVEMEARRYARQLTRASTSRPNTDINVTYYKLNLAITVEPPHLRGVVTVKALSRIANLTALQLDLTHAMTVDSVVCEDSVASFIQHPTTVVIELNRSYGYGEMVVLDVFYHGVPASTGFGSFEFGSHAGTPWVWTLSQPYGARDWWPCNDHPLDKADSVDIWVTCRSDLKVASNGKLTEVIVNPNSTTTYRWAERYPIATYLVFLSLTNYAEFTDWFRYSATDSMPILNYVLPEHLAAARDSFRVVPEMLRIFSNAFGLYPFIAEKYGHAEFGRGGAMEHQTMTSLVRSAFGKEVLAHELAHQWFGNLVTCASWSHLWLNEGFASYGESIYSEYKHSPERYRNSMRETMTIAKAATGPVFKADTSNIRQLFDQPTVYRKGASVLHMLRHVLGDSVFLHCLRAYVADTRLRFATATTEDFQRVCEAVAGRPLDWFFTQWIYGENYPRYSYRWNALPDSSGRYTVSITISQATGTSNPAFFTMPIDVRLSASNRDTTVTLFNTQNNQTFRVTVPFQPTHLELDPDEWILKDVVPPESDEPLPMSFILLQNYPNPFNETTTITYRIPTRSFVRLAVYDMLGRLVTTLVERLEEPGNTSLLFQAGTLASGVYVYRLQAGTFSAARKLVLLR